MNIKTFRLFISSTFSDFTLERNILHEKVFPKIEKYCQTKGWQFQPVDLRWGIAQEAQLDQKTLELCLNEVSACKHYPHPNFLIMVGDRYGWVPLPYAIEISEFILVKEYLEHQHLQDHLKSSEYERALFYLNEWYIEDTNYLIGNQSYAYILKVRESGGIYEELELWIKVENLLRHYLQEAANSIFYDKNEKEYRKYFLSATEAEVEEGIFQYISPTSKQEKLQKEFEDHGLNLPSLDENYVYGWIRQIGNKNELNLDQNFSKLYFDSDDFYIVEFKNRLIKSLGENVNIDNVSLTNNIEQYIINLAYFDRFESYMFSKLKNSVDHQIEMIKDISSLQQEISEHEYFKDIKSEIFFGREEDLKLLMTYIEGENDKPFIVHGISGIGKSSFIAKAIKMICSHKIVFRFIGTSAFSSNIRNLLELIIEDLAEKGCLDRPERFETGTGQFFSQIKHLLLSIREPVVIVLDALDQLQKNDYLEWLPLKLPNSVKIVLSMLDQNGYDHYYTLLKDNIDINNQLEMKELDIDSASATLELLLKKENRCLTNSQFNYIIKQYMKSGQSPLYLKIAFEEAKIWKSFDIGETIADNGVHDIIKEFIHNLTDKYHHPKFLIEKTLGLISASKYGLSEKEILDLMSRDASILNKLEQHHKLDIKIDGITIKKFPISLWSRLYGQLKPFISIRLIDNQNLLQFFHRQISEVVSYYIKEANKEKYHTDLANYFLEQSTNFTSFYNNRKLSELPFQLINSKMLDIFAESINVEFIKAKVEIGKSTEILDELNTAYLLLSDYNNEKINKDKLAYNLLNYLVLFKDIDNEVLSLENIHVSYVYETKFDFYIRFLELGSDRTILEGLFLVDENKLITQYYLAFLGRLANIERRKNEKTNLKNAILMLEKILDEYNLILQLNKSEMNEKSKIEYDIGYVEYLLGNYENAIKHIHQSVKIADSCEAYISGWISRCVEYFLKNMNQTISHEEYQSVLDNALDFFYKNAEKSENAKRWVMNVYAHSFRLAFEINNENKAREFYNKFINHQWTVEYNDDRFTLPYTARVHMVESNFSDAIEYFQKYLDLIDKNDYSKLESFARDMYDFGRCLYLNNNHNRAYSILKIGLDLPSEPGNHIWKEKIKSYLNNIAI